MADEATKAKAAIDQASDADGVIQATTAGVKAIDAQHQSATPLDTQKQQAKQAIDAEAAKVSKAIDQDVTLTATQKADQKQAVIAEADKAKKTIDAAGNADGIKQAESDGIKAIDAQHQSSQALADRKGDAKAAIDHEAAKETAAIDHDATLTANEKGKPETGGCR
uniref:DUF1542 domain-containing protein n=1 Tax=Lacticaseibacillus rhamnosus TaxID=47715 RepID=UPI000ADB27E0